ncbi:hypothetical protein AB3N60_01870 [Leptospira sp. WS39.C2]
MFPIQSVWLLRVSLVYFFIGTLLGALLMYQKVFVYNPSIWFLLPIHYSIMIWGFFLQFIMGTAYWMFPKHLSMYPRGSNFQAWCLLIGYNFGFFCLLISMIFSPNSTLEFIGKIMMLVSILIFIKLIWSRSISYNS